MTTLAFLCGRRSILYCIKLAKFKKKAKLHCKLTNFLLLAVHHPHCYSFHLSSRPSPLLQIFLSLFVSSSSPIINCYQDCIFYNRFFVFVFAFITVFKWCSISNGKTSVPILNLFLTSSLIPSRTSLPKNMAISGDAWSFFSSVMRTCDLK